MIHVQVVQWPDRSQDVVLRVRGKDSVWVSMLLSLLRKLGSTITVDRCWAGGQKIGEEETLLPEPVLAQKR